MIKYIVVFFFAFTVSLSACSFSKPTQFEWLTHETSLIVEGVWVQEGNQSFFDIQSTWNGEPLPIGKYEIFHNVGVVGVDCQWVPERININVEFGKPMLITGNMIGDKKLLFHLHISKPMIVLTGEEEIELNLYSNRYQTSGQISVFRSDLIKADGLVGKERIEHFEELIDLRSSPLYRLFN